MNAEVSFVASLFIFFFLAENKSLESFSKASLISHSDELAFYFILGFFVQLGL